MKTKKTFISVISVFMAMLMVLVNLSLPVGALSDEIVADSTVKPIVKPEDKIDPVLKEKMETASPDEKIPVAIWYTDVDQKEIDKMTAQKVGYSKDDVAVDYEMPSQELLSDLKADEEGADAELQAYMARTEQQREKEHKRTDDYIMTRREFSRAMYNEKSASIINDLNINEEEIVFNSQYAPMIIAELTVAEISLFSKKLSVTDLFYYEEIEEVPMDISNAMDSANVDMINEGSALGLTGQFSESNPIKVGLLEVQSVLLTDYDSSGWYTVPENNTPAEYTVSNNVVMKDYGNVVIVGDATYDPTYEHKDHADKVADTLTSVAPDVKLYSSNMHLYNIEAMITDGVLIFSRSVAAFISETSSNYGYSWEEKWYDHLVSSHGITTVVAAGNTGSRLSDSTYDEKGETKTKYGPRVTSPGLAYNVITVGAYHNMEGETMNSDTLFTYSSYKNSIVQNVGTESEKELIGCEKPDVIAPATFNGGGTSNATPFVAGMIALMYQLKPSLANYPQAVKAIVLASCHKKAVHLADAGEQEYIEDGITERQGAGAPDAFVMASIVSQGTYGIGVISDIELQDVRRFVVPNKNASNMNVSITWLKENTISNGLSHTNTSNVTTTADANLDLYVYQNNQLVGSSKIGSQSSTDNRISSTEMAYVSLSDNINDYYEIRIEKAEEYYESDVRYGYAYSTDAPYISTEDGEEGVYYIRNHYTNKYLTLSNNEVVMSNFTGENNQKWVISGTPGNYELIPAYDTAGTKINFGAQIGSTAFYKAVTGTSDLDLVISSWESDSEYEPDSFVFTTSSGGSQNILGYSSSYGAFARSASTPAVNMLRMWILEDINYRIGDVNMDGEIKISDATVVQNYVAGDVIFNNLQYYLADFNNDSKVNVRDATAIQSYLAGLGE